jgi:threonine/homoserine efflux transporter RhtA
MNQSNPGMWPGILVFSPPLSYLCWTYGFAGPLLQVSAAFVLLAIYIYATGRPSQWKKHAPYMLISGMIQFVLVIPMTGIVAQQEIKEMAGYSKSMAVAHVPAELPSSIQKLCATRF